MSEFGTSHDLKQAGPPEQPGGGPKSLLANWGGIRPLLAWLNFKNVARKQQLVRDGLAAAAKASTLPRVMATACWNFPIYSQAFVYQELVSLVEQGFDLRKVYSKLESRSGLHRRFNELWERKCKLHLHWKQHLQDFSWFQHEMPEKVESLVQRVSEAAGIPVADLLGHRHFLEAFSYARMVESFRPHYLHSYFFYQHSLYALVAAWLLEIPRGITCYADHMLADYELKLVELHLELCGVIVATSGRIKTELLCLGPQVDPAKIIVKPNAIDSSFFAVTERREPSGDEPFRLVCVSRIEPKKGLPYLVEAVKILRAEGLNLELSILGAADLGIERSEKCKADLVAAIAGAGLQDFVHLAGQTDQDGVRDHYGSSHLFVAPFVETQAGDKDGIPTALLEALSSGLPVVVTDAGSMTEVVATGKEGLVVPQRNSRALAGAIKELLQDAPRRVAMGQVGSQTIRSRFDVDSCEGAFHARIGELLK